MKREELKARVREMLACDINTEEFYFALYPHLGAERLALHEAIIDTILSRRDYSSNKRIYMLGGAPANGKSAFIRSGIVKYPDLPLKIDPDEIKMMLPEYRYLVGVGESRAAIVHDESSSLSKKVRQLAIAKGTDLILDGVANHSIETRIADTAALKSNGHWIRMDYVTLDTELSIRIAKVRFQQTGRQVPETLLRDASRNVATLVPQLIDLQIFDELYLWDTNIGVMPRLILWQKGRKLEVVDKSLYDNFKKKAHE